MELTVRDGGWGRVGGRWEEGTEKSGARASSELKALVGESGRLRVVARRAKREDGF